MANLQATFSPPSSWGASPPTPYKPGITLTDQQYPKQVILSGLNLYNSFHTDTDDDRWATIYLSDKDGQNKVGIATIGGSGWIHDWAEGNQYIWNVPDTNGKALKGKTLAFTKSFSDVYWRGSATVTVVTSDHVITWTNPDLAFAQNEYQLTVTKSGTATDNWGESFTVHLYMDGVDKGAFSGNSITITLTDDQLEIPHSFALVAVNSTTSTGVTKSFTPASVHKTVKYYTGSAWVECIVSVYDNGQWKEVEPFYYNGTAWVPCSQT